MLWKKIILNVSEYGEIGNHYDSESGNIFDEEYLKMK
jgi:hypothetical protein